VRWADRQRQLGRGARLLALRPPLALGGHTFVLVDGWVPGERCVRCHVWLPRWAVNEGLWSQFGLARLCPDLLLALPENVGREVVDPTGVA